ncbi:MAG TPA: oligosaccharide flippase family protein, partial [Methylobacter sp.]
MSRLTKNIIYNVIGQSFVLILGFVSVKFIYSRLGGDIVGIIYFAMMANTTLCMILELGVCSTTVREVSANYEKNPTYTHKFIRVFSSFYWILYIVVGLLIYLFAPLLVDKWLKLQGLDLATAVSALRILLISSLLALPKSFYASVVRGLQRMEINNSIDAALMGIQQLGIIVIIFQGGNLIHIAWWVAATHLLGLLAYIIACLNFFPVKIL